MGNTKLLVSLETPAFSRTQRIVTGNVALDELVENAVAIAEAIALKCFIGLIFVIIKKKRGNTKKTCIDNHFLQIVKIKLRTKKMFEINEDVPNKLRNDMAKNK